MQTLHVTNVDKKALHKRLPNSAGTSLGPYQNMQVQPYSPPTTETLTVTASCAVPQSSL